MTLDLDSALLATRELVLRMDQLETQGWAVEQQSAVLTLRSNGDDPQSLADVLKGLGPVLVDAKLSARWSEHELELRYVDGDFVVSVASPGDLSHVFEGTELDAAQDAWGGDAPSALGLAGAWSATGKVDPAKMLQCADNQRRWYVLRNIDALTALIAERPWWDLAGLIESSEMVVAVVGQAPSSLDVRTAGLRVRSLEASIPWPAQVLNREVPMVAGLARTSATRPTNGTPMPSTLAPVSAGAYPAESDVGQLHAQLWQACAATAWAWLATTVELSDSQFATLEFFGLQRTRHKLAWNGPGISMEQCRASYDLWCWATSGDGPDQFLAARQVISLYREAEPWSNARDVQRAAEPIFVALRSDATAEAFRMQREARALALNVARDTAEATIGQAKGAVERCLAALAGIGGVIIAQTTSALTVSQATKLRMLIAFFLFIMVAWSVFIEGPTSTIALDSLSADMGKLGELLSEGQRQEALDLVTVQKTRRQSRLIRIAVPGAYLAAAIVALNVH